MKQIYTKPLAEAYAVQVASVLAASEVVKDGGLTYYFQEYSDYE